MRLLDLGLFRVGNERYEADNESYGLTTIKRRHMRIKGREATFSYPSKSGQESTHTISDPSVLPTLKALKERTGGRGLKDLLVYKEDGRWHDLASTDVNAFIKETAGEGFSAKDFRTWNATVLAAFHLATGAEDVSTKAARKRAASTAVGETARYLNNTPAVCRAAYIDPRVFDRFEAGETIRAQLERIERAAEPGEFADRERIERAVLKLLS